MIVVMAVFAFLTLEIYRRALVVGAMAGQALCILRAVFSILRLRAAGTVFSRREILPALAESLRSLLPTIGTLT